MKKYLFVPVILILILSCKKQTEKQEDLYIRGRLFLLDTLTQNSLNTPLPNKMIQLAELGADSLNFLYSDTTDRDGYFVFNLLNNAPKEKQFVVRYSEKVSSIWYSGSDTATKGQTNVVLQATLDQIKQNGFYVYLKDSLGGGIPLGKILIFNSLVLANINNPAGAVDSILANSNGKACKINLSAGTYYLNAKKTVDTLVFERRIRQITIPQSGIILLNPDSIQLKRTH